MAGKFDMQTSLEVMGRLKADYSSGEDAKSAVEGTFAFDTLSANAQEFEKSYAEMSLLQEAAFIQDSWGDYLTDKAAEHGVIRKEAAPAIVALTITGTAETVVKRGNLFATEDGVNFETIEPVVIGADGTATVKAEAQEKGSAGNVLKETITHIPVTIYGVTAVTNEAAAYNGYDEETDDALRERALYKVRMPATSGNAYHYVEWATEVEGVGAARCIRLWNGPGTVKVIITDSNKDSPSAELVQQVYNHITEEAPIGATLTVAAPVALPVTISFDVLNGSADAEAVKACIEDYFKEKVFDMGDITQLATYPDGKIYVSYAQIGRAILDNVETTGVKDYGRLLVNGATNNIVVGAEEMPVVSEVIINGQ